MLLTGQDCMEIGDNCDSSFLGKKTNKQNKTRIYMMKICVKKYYLPPVHVS